MNLFFFSSVLLVAEFSIWTREAGAGGLSIAVEGPSKAEIAFEDRKDGSSGVSYIVQEPGENREQRWILFVPEGESLYLLTILFSGFPVADILGLFFLVCGCFFADLLT